MGTALVGALAVVLFADGRVRSIGLVLTGGMALATLARTGHGAMDEGGRGTVC